MAGGSEDVGAGASALAAEPVRKRTRLTSAAHEKAMKAMKQAKETAAAELKNIRSRLKQDSCHIHMYMYLLHCCSIIVCSTCDMLFPCALDLVFLLAGKSSACPDSQKGRQTCCVRAPRDCRHERDQERHDARRRRDRSANRRATDCRQGASDFEQLQQRAGQARARQCDSSSRKAAYRRRRRGRAPRRGRRSIARWRLLSFKLHPVASVTVCLPVIQSQAATGPMPDY